MTLTEEFKLKDSKKRELFCCFKGWNWMAKVLVLSEGWYCLHVL